MLTDRREQLIMNKREVPTYIDSSGRYNGSDTTGLTAGNQGSNPRRYENFSLEKKITVNTKHWGN